MIELDVKKLIELYLDARDFIIRFDAWIAMQPESVALSSALAFGEEYQRLRQWFEGVP